MSTHDGYGHDGYDDYEDEAAYEPPPPRRGGATPLGAGLVGLLVGALLAAIALSVVGGNPFSDANDVVYREVVVADVSDDADSLCWSTQPGRRDAPQECAILALDPTTRTPSEGDRVTVGVVRLRTPNGDRFLQVVYASGGAADGDEPAEPADGGEVDSESPDA